MRLAVNIDHVATLREARGETEPDPVTAAQICELAGAEGIVCHLREDRRHVNDRDLRLLREVVKTKLDLEMAATEEIIGIAIDVLPELATLVPERREELTTEGGLDVVAGKKHLREVIKRLNDHDIAVSLFVDPIPAQVEAAGEIGADLVELHTGAYARAVAETDQNRLLDELQAAATLASGLGMGVNAGHGLNYVNITGIVKIREIGEVSIGHAVIARAVYSGLETAIRDMIRLLRSG